MVTHPKEMARAITSSFLADMARSPTLNRAIDEGKISARKLHQMMMEDLRRAVRGEGPSWFPNLRATLKTQMNVEELRMGGGLGQWAEMFNSLATAASKYVVAREEAKAQKDIAETQAKAEAARAEAEAQRAAAEAEKARLALATGQGAPAGASVNPGGFPTWGWYALGGVAVVGTGAAIYAATKGGGRRRRR